MVSCPATIEYSVVKETGSNIKGAPPSLKRKRLVKRLYRSFVNPPTPEVWINFWSFVTAPSCHECWSWTGYSPGRRAPKYGWDGKNVPIQRLLFIWLNGYFPKTFTVVPGKCCNPECINPYHILVRGTEADQELRRYADSAGKKCAYGHDLRGTNLIKYKLRLGVLSCRKCATREYLNRDKKSGQAIRTPAVCTEQDAQRIVKREAAPLTEAQATLKANCVDAEITAWRDKLENLKKLASSN